MLRQYTDIDLNDYDPCYLTTPFSFNPVNISLDKSNQ